jgi:hypothetical protein
MAGAVAANNRVGLFFNETLQPLLLSRTLCGGMCGYFYPTYPLTAEHFFIGTLQPLFLSRNASARDVRLLLSNVSAPRKALFYRGAATIATSPWGIDEQNKKGYNTRTDFA